ncbi:MAG: hypothetical protein AB3N22_10200 [Ruegeria sp.]
MKVIRLFAAGLMAALVGAGGLMADTPLGPDGTPLSLDTRVVPRHVYEQRRQVGQPVIPRGYRSVWTDGRLNQHRAEHTLRPAVAPQGFVAPRGYRAVRRADDRLNPRRGLRSAYGDAQTDLVWQSTTPRKLNPASSGGRIATVQRVGPTYLGQQRQKTSIDVFSGNVSGVTGYNR